MGQKQVIQLAVLWTRGHHQSLAKVLSRIQQHLQEVVERLTLYQLLCQKFLVD
jgi:hypothetical protein